MTPATPAPTNSPVAAMDTATPSWMDKVRANADEILAIFKRSPEWIVILCAWLVTAFLPMYWYIGEDRWWSQPDSPLFLQPLTPIVIGVLLWHNRDNLLTAYRQTPRSKRHGAPWLFWLGCLLVLGGHFVHVLTFAALGLLLAAVGITYMAYGMPVLIQASRSFLFGVCFIPPPATFAAGISNFVGWNVMKASAVVAQKLGRPVTVSLTGDSTAVDLANHVTEVISKQVSGAAFTVFCLFLISLWRREKVGPSLLTFAAGALVAIILSFFFPLVAMVLPVNPLTDHILSVPPLLVAAIAVTVTVLVKKRMKVWQGGIASGTRTLEKLSEQAQKATDRATAGVAASVGGSTRRAGRNFTKGTEGIMDAIGNFFSKPFKRKRKDHW